MSTVPEPVNPLLLTAQQVADLLQVSRRTLWRLLKTGRLPEPIRVGSIVRWRLNELRAWIADGCRTPLRYPNESSSGDHSLQFFQERLTDMAVNKSGAGGRNADAAPLEATAWRTAKRCRAIIQGCLREEEWHDADSEFCRIILEVFLELEAERR